MIMLKLFELIEVVAQGLHGFFGGPETSLVSSLGHGGHERVGVFAHKPDSVGNRVPKLYDIFLGSSYLVEGVRA